MKTLDYVILAGLIRMPRSGYDLSRWMQRETSHFFAIGHSSIYPALARMEREGLVRYEVVPSERGPQRKVYSITEVGREALLCWVGEPAAERQVHDEQLVKALCYPYMPKERALARLGGEVRPRGEAGVVRSLSQSITRLRKPRIPTPPRARMNPDIAAPTSQRFMWGTPTVSAPRRPSLM